MHAMRERECVCVAIFAVCRWSKREEQDFGRVITFFGIIFDSKTNKYDWRKFR